MKIVDSRKDFFITLKRPFMILGCLHSAAPNALAISVLMLRIGGTGFFSKIKPDRSHLALGPPMGGGFLIFPNYTILRCSRFAKFVNILRE